jgi:hypothetical protein
LEGERLFYLPEGGHLIARVAYIAVIVPLETGKEDAISPQSAKRDLQEKIVDHEDLENIGDARGQ